MVLLHQALKSISSSPYFKKILFILLTVVNYLNENEAKGFLISSLIPISEQLSANKKSCLAKSIFSLLHANKSPLVSLTEEFYNVPLIASLDIENMSNDIKLILKELLEMKKELDVLEMKLKSGDSTIEIYYTKLLDFTTSIMEQYEEIESLFEEVRLNFSEFSESLGESKQAKLTDIMTPIKVFIKNFKE